MGSVSFYTLLRVPELTTQGNHPTSSSTPIYFIPENVNNQTNYDAYCWDKINKTVKKISGLNDDIVEGHIDNGTAYIVVVSMDKLIDNQTGGGRDYSSCEQGFSCTDYYCDKRCGEPETCYDCQTQYNKKLYLYKVKINDDVRIRKSGTAGTVVTDHFVNTLGGKYKLGLNSVVVHGNGKWEAVDSEEIRPKWKQEEVSRSVVNSTSVLRQKGTNTWKIVYINGDEESQLAQKGIKLSDNFNPYKGVIYLSLYEEDNLFGLNRNISPPVFNKVGISKSQSWKSKGMPTLTGPSKENFYKDEANNPTIFSSDDVYVIINPNAWVDPLDPTKLLDEIELNLLNATIILRYEDY